MVFPQTQIAVQIKGAIGPRMTAIITPANRIVLRLTFLKLMAVEKTLLSQNTII
ncbi:hypothetical protein Glove_130g60 [Diversispora epigaea]|uniref:Uncharacterized protein n=1 Tax=Diversispora epigaea TaxID=1348612 RepID=A0A397J0P6_9GLOM|nr:hypothetical protein Glove_130g60 [Diversispora epigaea]